MNYVNSAVIKDKIFHTNNILELLVVPDIVIKYNPGSFVQLTLEIVSASERWPDSRTFSIASYNDAHMRFLIQREGYYTSKIFDETFIGQKITLKYPFGEMFSPKTINSKHVFIAGGLGITPFIGLTEYFEKKNKLDNLTLFYSSKNIDNLLFIDFFKKRIKDLHIHVTQQKTQYKDSRIGFEELMQYSKETHFYICGSKEFITNYNFSLTSKKYTNIHLDDWN